jgi:hypothetical protein
VVWWQPNVVPWVNHVRAGSYACVTWVAIVWLFFAFGIGACG